MSFQKVENRPCPFSYVWFIPVIASTFAHALAVKWWHQTMFAPHGQCRQRNLAAAMGQRKSKLALGGGGLWSSFHAEARYNCEGTRQFDRQYCCPDLERKANSALCGEQSADGNLHLDNRITKVAPNVPHAKKSIIRACHTIVSI